jgi:hypothetical protein
MLGFIDHIPPVVRAQWAISNPGLITAVENIIATGRVDGAAAVLAHGTIEGVIEADEAVTFRGSIANLRLFMVSVGGAIFKHEKVFPLLTAQS